jgi:hypothetical protein
MRVLQQAVLHVQGAVGSLCHHSALRHSAGNGAVAHDTAALSDSQLGPGLEEAGGQGEAGVAITAQYTTPYRQYEAQSHSKHGLALVQHGILLLARICDH